MLIKDIPLTNQVELLTLEDKNSIGEIIFQGRYDQDCVDKIWEHIKKPEYIKNIKFCGRSALPHLPPTTDLLSYMYRNLENMKIRINMNPGEEWDATGTISFMKEKGWELVPPHCKGQVKESIARAVGTARMEAWNMLDNVVDMGRFNHELQRNQAIKLRRWFCAPFCDRFSFVEVEGEDLTYKLVRSGTRKHSGGLREAMLSDFQYDPLDRNHEDSYPPRDYIQEQNNLAPPDRKMCEKGSDPRRRYLREQYHIISENYEALGLSWNCGEEEVAERIKNFCLNANLWSVHKGPNGNPIFRKNQSDIKYYKDYLKIQLGLLITPFKNTTDKIGYMGEDGKRYFLSMTHMGFRKGRWRKYGIGEVEAYNCSLLNYIGREQIFQNDGEGVLFIRDGQYLIRN